MLLKLKKHSSASGTCHLALSRAQYNWIYCMYQSVLTTRISGGTFINFHKVYSTFLKIRAQLNLGVLFVSLPSLLSESSTFRSDDPSHY